MTTIINNGNARAYPIIVIRGPGDLSLIQNERISARLAFQYTLQTGEVVIIDTRPGFKTAVSSFTDNLLLSGGLLPSDLASFFFEPGVNEVSTLILNDTIDTSISMSFQERYLSFDG